MAGAREGRAGLRATRGIVGMVLLAWERAAAHARAIRFGDAQNVMQLPRPDARARCSRASHAMAAGHKGISAMIDIEQRGLILIGRANAAASGTDSFIVCARFARLVKRNVIRQYQRCRAGDE